MPGQPPEFDMMTFLAEFRLPAIAGPWRRWRRRSEGASAVLSAAHRIALEGAQAAARRHMEILQAAMAEMTQALGGLARRRPIIQRRGGPPDRGAEGGACQGRWRTSANWPT